MKGGLLLLLHEDKQHHLPYRVYFLISSLIRVETRPIRAVSNRFVVGISFLGNSGPHKFKEKLRLHSTEEACGKITIHIDLLTQFKDTCIQIKEYIPQSSSRIIENHGIDNWREDVHNINS